MDKKEKVFSIFTWISTIPADGSSFMNLSYKCAFKLLELAFLDPWSDSLFFFGRFLLRFDLSLATEEETLVSCGNIFLALIEYSKKLL